MPEEKIKRTTINTGKNWCEVIELPNVLKAKTSSGPGWTPEEMLQRAAERVAALADEFAALADSTIAAMTAEVRDMGQGPERDERIAARLYRASHDMKGQGSTFGYDLISAICKSLCALLERTEVTEKRLVPAISTHLDALTLVRGQKIRGTGGSAGEALITALQREVEVVGGPPPETPKLTGGNRKGADLPALPGDRFMVGRHATPPRDTGDGKAAPPSANEDGAPASTPRQAKG